MIGTEGPRSDAGDGSSANPAIAERLLVRAWQRGLRPPLRTADGRPLDIVFRGRCLGGAGPDVRGALLAFDGGRLVEGDVEFHLRASDWFGHGHARDPHYRSVILHVVRDADAPPPPDADGNPMPTLVLSADDLAGLAPADDPVPGSPAACHQATRQRGGETVVPILDALGDRRLTERAARFEAELTRNPPEAIAYEALLDALGFSRNREPFVRLARAVPIGLLLAILGRRPAPEALVLAEAILFGVAGLLPSQRSGTRLDWEANEVVEELEAIWALYRADWEGQGLRLADWTVGGVRPANHPARRIATAARLVVRHRAAGLDRALLAPLRAGAWTSASLESLFEVDDPESYWATRADFGQALPGPPAALLGKERARDAVVNVALPLALAIAADSGDQALVDAAWNAYHRAPYPAAYLVTQRLAADLGLRRAQVGTARRQQGLLYLSRNHCERAACESCPLIIHQAEKENSEKEN